MKMQDLGNTEFPAAEMAALVPRYLRLRECLRRDLALLEPGERLPSVAELRAQYQVSQSTFDRALEGLRREGLIRTHQGKGMYTTESARCRRIGLVFGTDIFANGQMYNQLLLGSLQRQARHNRHLLYYFFEDPCCPEGEHALQQLAMEVQAGRLDGLLASSGFGVHPDGWDHLASFGLPFVAFAHRGQLPNRVCLDWTAMIRLGTAELLRQGCRRIGLWHRSPYQANQKSAAFMETLAHAGATTRPEWNVIATHDRPVESVAEDLFRQQWLAWDEKPDGIVCGDDIMTQGLVHASSLLGIRIPDELRFASHANKGANTWGAAAITRVEFDLDQVAEAMLARLDMLMAGQRPEPDVLMIQPSLVPSPTDA